MKKAFKRTFSVCLASAILASTGSAAITANAEQTENPATNLSAPVSSEERHSSDGNYMPREESHMVSLSDYYAFEGEGHSTPADLPDECDNSANENKRFFPAIDTQGSIGACEAWASTYYTYTYERNRALGIDTTPENTFSPSWTYNLCNGGNDSGSQGFQIYNVIRIAGAARRKDVPIYQDNRPESNWRDWFTTGENWANATHDRLTAVKYFRTRTTAPNGVVYNEGTPVPSEGTPVTGPKDSDLDMMKVALNDGHVLNISSCIFSWKTTYIKESSEPGVDNRFAGHKAIMYSDGFDGSHGLTVVGYNDNIWIDINNNDMVDSGEMGAMKIANSWGEIDGTNGFYWMAYDALNKVSAVKDAPAASLRYCLISEPAVVKVENKDYSSGILFKCVLNSDCRYETKVDITAREKSTGKTYTSTIAPYNTNFYLSDSENYNGVEKTLGYNGEKGACDGTFYYDLNNVVSDISLDNINDFDWTVRVNNMFDNSSYPIVKELLIVNMDSGKAYSFMNGSNVTVRDSYKDFTSSNIEFGFNAAVRVTPGSDIGVYENADIKVSANGSKGSLSYNIECTKDGSTVFTSDSDSVSYQFTEAGVYTITASVTNAQGETVTTTKDITVRNTSIENITPDRNKLYPNQAVTFTPDVQNLASVIDASCFTYTVTKDGVSTQYAAGAHNELEWVPTETGVYTVKLDIDYLGNHLADKTVSFTVNEKPTDIVTIYYSGYTTPYIHYRTAGGSWTTAPGVAMEQSSEVSGYPFEYTIELDGAQYAEVCFNDGNGHWDSKNGANYRFEKGSYKFSNGTITPYEKPVYSTALNISEYAVKDCPLSFYTYTKNGAGSYKYTFTVTHNGVTKVLAENNYSYSASFTPDEIGDYVVSVTVKDAQGKTTSDTKTVTVKEVKITELHIAPETGKVGQPVQISLDVDGHFEGIDSYVSIYHSYWTDSLYLGKNVTGTWTPNEADEYTITASIRFNGRTVASVTKEYTVEEAPVPENTVTIYYNGYANPNIHYQVGSGAWTNVPGVAMEAANDVPGYTHKYTIDLGDADYANVCFNDGNGHWDSRNGANYRFTKGTYKFSNGTITAM